MVLIKEKIPSVGAEGNALNANSMNSIIPKHYAGVYGKRYEKQPDSLEMGRITNYFKYKSFSKRHGIDELLNQLSSGHCVIPCHYQYDSETDLNVFVSASWFAVDVDDDDMKTDPVQVLASLSNKAAALFYTFSHGIKGNRFRLIFQFDKAIHNEVKFRLITEMIAAELKEQGLPVDEKALTPTTPIRPGIKGHIINDLSVKLNTDELMKKAEKESEKRAKNRRESFVTEFEYKWTFEDLREMALKVGHIPTGSGRGGEWNAIVYGLKHYVETGAITDSEGYELFDIISGSESSEKVWQGMKPTGRATIGTLIHSAKTNGFTMKKSYRYAQRETPETANIERRKVNGYIPMELAKSLLEREQKLLVDSPTGSGKTENFIKAFKELATNTSRSVYIFSAPTRTLTKQISKKYEILAVKGNNPRLFKDIFSYAKSGKRIFVCTYDMTPLLIETLKNQGMGKLYLVIDEYHKTVADYSPGYRNKAIKNMLEAAKEATSFIALSGTPEEVLKADFDKVIRIDNGVPASPCMDFVAHTYEKKKDYIPTLVKMIEETTKRGRKMLIFIQNKDDIEKVTNLLRLNNVKVRTITADSGFNPTREQIIEKETIDNDVKVVLSTTVIADGVTIKNKLMDNGMEWECMAVCNERSDLFNVSLLKQISNRFRDDYRRFSVFMLSPINEEEKRFNIEAAYQYNKGVSDRFVDLINDNFSGRDFVLFNPSILENKFGITKGENGAAVDPLFIRHLSSEEQNRYYSGRRIAFVKALETMLHKKCSGFDNVNERIRANDFSLDDIEKEAEIIETAQKEKKERKKSSITNTFKQNVWQALQNDDEEALEEFKKEADPTHFKCLKQIGKIASFEVCKTIVTSVKRDADAHKFLHAIKALADIAHFAKINRMSPTKKVFLKLSQLDEYLPTEEFEEEITRIANKMRLKTKTVKEVLRMFEQSKKRIGKDRTRSTALKPLTIESVAEEFGLTTEQVKETLKNYVNADVDVSAIKRKNVINYYSL